MKNYIAILKIPFKKYPVRALFPAFQYGSIIGILSMQTAHEGC